MDRLIYRAIIVDPMSNRNDLRILANQHGLLKIFLTGTSRSLTYAGLNEELLPASVAEGGSNAAIAKSVHLALSRGYTIAHEWIEPKVNLRKRGVEC